MRDGERAAGLLATEQGDLPGRDDPQAGDGTRCAAGLAVHQPRRPGRLGRRLRPRHRRLAVRQPQRPYDIVGFDPRGTGASQNAIDCKVNPEEHGVYAQPFTTPDNLDARALVAEKGAYARRCRQLNKDVLPYVTTGNVARDLDLLRAAVGDEKLTYLGFSYGTFLGATYASLFPDRLGRVVLDGPVDANEYINEPMDDLSAQTSGFERAIGRFFQACAGDQATCLGFGDGDPWSAFDVLAAQLDTKALPADGYTPDPRPVDGDDSARRRHPVGVRQAVLALHRPDAGERGGR